MAFVIASLNVGAVGSEIDATGRTFRSAVRRTPVSGPLWLGEDGFAGDASAYKGHHGPNMTLHVFSIDHYAHYERLASRPLPVPAFGENFTTIGGVETGVCIGDRYAVGGASVAITQPTERCATPGRALGLPSLRGWIEASGYTGYYMRVLRPGWVAPGDTLTLQDRPLSQWSVDRVTRALRDGLEDDRLFETVLALEPLSNEWKARMRTLRARKLAANARGSRS